MSGVGNEPAAARRYVPFPVSPRGKAGAGGFPHAGRTLHASQKRWHATMPPAPPHKRATAPCASPANGGRNSVASQDPFTQNT